MIELEKKHKWLNVSAKRKSLEMDQNMMKFNF